ncbi:hypothetical protein GCM10029963_03910 [Micromonospora andamanensis]
MPGRRARRAWVAALAALLGLLAAVAPATPAAAHAVLLGTDPADGAVLATVPAEVTLTFNEPVTVRPGGVRLLDAAGDELSTDSRSVDTTVVLAIPPDLADGTYIVAFRVISADSHPVSGGFSFAVGAPSSAAVMVPESRPSGALNVLRQAAEAVAYLGLLVSAGLLVFLLVLLRAEAPVLRRRLLRLAGWSAGLTVLARLVLVPAVPAWQDGGELTGLIDGARWLTGLRSEEALSSVLVVLGLGVALWATATAGTPFREPGVVETPPLVGAVGEATTEVESTVAGRRPARHAVLAALAFAAVALAWGLSLWSGIPAPTVRPGWSSRPTSCTSPPPGCGWADWWHCPGRWSARPTWEPTRPFARCPRSPVPPPSSSACSAPPACCSAGASCGPGKRSGPPRTGWRC